jgi:branched-chain amino acid transport system permease protein
VNLFLQLLANGVATGALYVIFGLSFGLIFNTTRVFHFAHGAVYTIAAYAVYVGVVRLALPLPVAAAAAGVLAAAAGVACEAGVYRPLRRRDAPPILVLVASFAILLFFQNLFILIFGGSPLPLSQEISRSVRLGPVHLVWLDAWKLAGGAAVTAVTLLYLFRTRWGQATRAVVANPTMAAIVGIPPDRVYLWTYALGSLLLLPAAVIEVAGKGASPYVGTWPLLTATIVVFVGGVGVIPASIASGLFLGVLENVSVYWLPSQWQDTIAFVVLIAFLLARPMGFFGSEVRRV